MSIVTARKEQKGDGGCARDAVGVGVRGRGLLHGVTRARLAHDPHEAGLRSRRQGGMVLFCVCGVVQKMDVHASFPATTSDERVCGYQRKAGFRMLT